MDKKYKVIGISILISILLIVSLSVVASAIVIQGDKDVSISVDKTVCFISSPFMYDNTGNGDYTGNWQKTDDMDSSDGKLTYLYAGWVLKDPDNVIIQESLPTQFSGGYYNANTLFNATKIGNYSLRVAMMYVKQEYNSTTYNWEVTDSGICQIGWAFPTSKTISVTYKPSNINDVMNIVMTLFNNWK